MEYRLLDDTGDLGIEVKGEDFSKLFENLGNSIYDIMLKREDVFISKIERDTLKEDSLEDLLIKFSNMIIYKLECKRFVGKIVKADFKKSKKFFVVDYKIFGERFVPSRHFIKNVFKAATYHNFEMVEDEKYKKVKIYFDL
ncbi:MAG: Protein archease [candidate division TA06 bacterium 32_111]|uniref:Protein archease n=2 Tax=Bacteria candidate phyla TaxID=1783234 RepID=A0A101I2A4_UNCT6|nr:MAG: Protein archease [candidate division TA06 bacterium 32_111]KUK86923.1 MAG: Protein archease [candidate division TA06 bacterium 34_109]HAF07246.1 hypothetical protein [candidate division WOR-3 bacterium]HCP16640.1 hypothetical protein [candidate division WOR-3 bacterium]